MKILLPKAPSHHCAENNSAAGQTDPYSERLMLQSEAQAEPDRGGHAPEGRDRDQHRHARIFDAAEHAARYGAEVFENLQGSQYEQQERGVRNDLARVAVVCGRDPETANAGNSPKTECGSIFFNVCFGGQE